MALTKVKGSSLSQGITRVFDAVSDMVASTELSIGDKVQTLGYYSAGDGGGNIYEIVASGTGTADGGSYIDLTGISGQAKGLFVDGVVNVRQFGAKGDGVTDDTAAIYNAFQRGGRILGIGGDTYKISYSILVKDNTVFDGNNCEFLMSFSVAGAAFISATYATANAKTSDVVLKNFRIKGQKPGSIENGIGVTQAKNWVLQNVECDNIDYHLVDIGGSEDICVENCRATNCGGAAYQVDHLVDLGTVFAATSSGTSVPNVYDAAAPEWTLTKNVTIRSCFAGDQDIGVQLHRGVTSYNINIIGNRFDNCTRAILGDDGYNCNGVVISNNVFADCITAIRIASNTNNLVISDNSFMGPADGNTSTVFAYGIDLFKNSTGTPNGIVVSGNVFQRLQIPIKIDTRNDVVVTGNQLFDVTNKSPGASIGSSAIQLIDCSNAVVDGNQINRAFDAGIRIRESSGSSISVSVTNNLFRSTRNQILVEGADGFVISGNNVGGYDFSGYPIKVDGAIRGEIFGNVVNITGTNLGAIGVVNTPKTTVYSNVSIGNVGVPFVFDGSTECNSANNVYKTFGGAVALEAKNGANVTAFEPFINSSKMSSDGTSTLGYVDQTYTYI